MSEWVQGLGILKGAEKQEDGRFMNIQVGNAAFTAELADNSSAKALAAKLAENPVTISM